MIIQRALPKDRSEHLRLLHYRYCALPRKFRSLADVMKGPLWDWRNAGPWSRSERPRVFLALTKEKLVGALSYLPIRIKWGKKEKKAYWLFELVVHPLFRKKLSGVACRLISQACRLPGLKLALDIHPVAKKICTRRFLWRERRGVEYWGSKLGRNLDQDKRKVLSPFPFRALRVERFPKEVDGLYKKVSRGYSVLIRRDAQYLNWRYVDIPFQKNPYLKFLILQGRNLVGVLVLRKNASRPQTGVIKEMFIDRKNELLLRFCLRFAKMTFQNKGVRIVKILRVDRDKLWDQNSLKEGFFPLFVSPGFIHSPVKSVRSTSVSPLKKMLYLSAGDSDLGLIFS